MKEHYKVVFGDDIWVTVKRGNEYAKEAIFVAYGVRKDNKRELLILEQNPTESAQFWGEMLRELKEKRGVGKIDLFIADGIQYLEDELAKVYPETEFQKCVVHKMRNVLNKTSPKDKKEVAEDLKEVFNNFDKYDTLKVALSKIQNFLKK